MKISTNRFFLNVMGKNRNNNRVYFALRLGNFFRFSVREKSGVNVRFFNLEMGNDY